MKMKVLFVETDLELAVLTMVLFRNNVVSRVYIDVNEHDIKIGYSVELKNLSDEQRKQVWTEFEAEMKRETSKK